MAKFWHQACFIFINAFLLASCSTTIGGNYSTAEASGSNMGPATLSSGPSQISNDELAALTVTGSLVGSELKIGQQLRVESSAILTYVKVMGQTTINGDLSAGKSVFKQDLSLTGNLSSNRSDFDANIYSSGNQIQLSSRSYVRGNIYLTNKNPGQIIIDRSRVRGNIFFYGPAGRVIVRNNGKLDGQISNGQLITEK